MVQQSKSFREFAQKVGYKKNCSGATINIIKKRLEDLNISTKHFGCERKFLPPCEEKDVFCKDSKVSQSTLRKWFKKKNTKYVCSICGQLPTWHGLDLTLILDHKNGKNNDNRLSNLRWVCPNCNSQLETTGSRNPNRKMHKKIFTCLECDKEISKNSKYCRDCFNKIFKSNQPRKFFIDRETLKKEIRTKSFTQIGRENNVTDNSVKKLCKKYGLPFRKSEIDSISDSDWENL